MLRDNDHSKTQNMNVNASAFSCRFPPEGSDFGRYKSMTVIGEGGMGRVYRAYDPMLDIELAVKVIPRGLYASKEERRRFMREIRLLAGLTIPGVVRLFDCGEEDGWHYYTMELLEGDTLRDYVKTHDLSVERRLQLMVELGLILQLVHDQDIIHRDLKPSNVIVTKDGQLRLTDFGIAKRFSENDAESAITLMDSRPGTPFYMSPEPTSVLKNLRMAKKADVYSLAVMTYELLTGKLPHDLENLTVTECVLVIREEPPYSFKDRRTAVPKPIDQLIMSALDKNPENRPSAGLFAEQLQAAMGPTVKPIKAAASSRPWSMVAALLLVGVILGGLYQFYSNRKKNDPVITTSVQTGSQSSAQVDTTVTQQVNVTTDDTTVTQQVNVTPDDTTVENVVETVPPDKNDGAGATNEGNGDNTTETQVVEQKPSPKELFQASLAQANAYLEKGDWGKAEKAYMELVTIPGYENCNEAPEGVRNATCGRLMDSTRAAVKRNDWETVQALTEDVLSLKPRHPEALQLATKATQALLPVLTVSVWYEGKEIKDATVIVDGETRLENSPASITIDRPGKHTLQIIAPRTHDQVFRPYRADVYMGDGPLQYKATLVAMKTQSVNDLNMDMVPISKGHFRLGQADDLGRGYNGVTVHLTRSFWISRFEVSQGQYYTIQRNNPSSVLGENYPVTRVTWNQAMEFCNRFTERERKAGRLPDGYVYRLPTEAEWEYCAKAGSVLSIGIPKDANVGKHVACANSKLGHYAEVGYGRPNAWGIYNMLGNAREWVWDVYTRKVITRHHDPQGPDSGTSRVVRGGSWRNSINECTTVHRDRSVSPNRSYSDVGFRIVLAPKLN